MLHYIQMVPFTRRRWLAGLAGATLAGAQKPPVAITDYYPKMQADEIERARKVGARGIKVLKILGLGLRENVTTGKLIKVDDPRFDTMWEAAAAHKMPVAIHTSDPEAFFLPINSSNERYE